MKKIIFLILLIPFNVFALTEAAIDITNLSIYEIQEYVDKGYLTYEQINKIYLERIEEYNELYNAVITVNENTIEEAKKLDKEYKEKGKRSLLHGLPILVKDNIDVLNMPTTNGTKALLDSYPYKNATIIQKLVDAGAIIIGKTNMDEFAFNASFSKSSFGYVYNAYNTKYSSYGSSGGTAVGVASGLAVAGIGTDTGTSIRLPSAANNLVGLRPTYDIIANDGIIKFESLRDVAGPITKYVTDNAIILEIMDNTNKSYQDNFKIENLNNIKIGVFRSVYNNSSKFIRDLMDIQINNLEDLGAEVIFVDTFYPTYKFDATTLCSDFNEYIQGTNSKIKSLDDLIKNGNYTQYITGYNGYYCYNDYKKTDAYKNYVNIRNNNINYVNNKFKDLDAVIYPTLQSELLLMSEIYTRKLKTYSSELAPLVGFPSMNIPIGFYNKLPYGMEIVSKANNEDIIYKIAYLLENKNNFYKLPDISPNLYQPNETVIDLINCYKNNTKKEYEKINNEVNAYLLSYNYDDNKTKELIKKYEDTKIIIEENEIKKDESKETIGYTIICLFLLVIIYKIEKRRKRK